MKNKKDIKNIVNELFDGISYSKQSEEMKTKVEEALDKKSSEYEKTEPSTLSAEGKVMYEYGTLEKAAEISSTTKNDLINIIDRKPTHGKRELRKDFVKGKTLSIVLALLIMNIVTNIVHCFLLSAPLYLVNTAIEMVISYFLLKQYKKICNRLSYNTICFDSDAKKKYDIYLDRYKKRHINFTYVLLAFLVEFSKIFENATLVKLTTEEIVGLADSEIWVTTIGVALFIYSLFTVKLLLCASSNEAHKAYRKYMQFQYIECGIFALCATVVTVILRQFINNPFPVLYIMTVIFIAVNLLINYHRRIVIVIQNIRVNRTRIACFTMVIVLLMSLAYMRKDVYVLQPYIGSVSAVEHNESEISYDDATGEYTITTSSDDFKILHLTDIHLGGSIFSSYKDYKALEACRKLIEYTKPDFIVVTGDMVFSMGIMSFSFNNEAPVREFAAFMRNIGIPWAFTFGNHDTEAISTASVEEITDLYKSLSYKSSGKLLYPYTQPDITGRSNQLIQIRNEDGTIRQALFLIDSNDYMAGIINNYDYIHDDQVDWYADQVKRLNQEEGKIVPSMVFFHIPLQEYRTANQLYEEGNDEVKYYFGKIGETMIDKICCSEYPSKLFDTAVELGSTRAMFCGHDHYNNISLEYKGIRLNYGMSIDYLAMPGIDKKTEQRGAELITIKKDSTFDIKQIRLSDI